MTGPIVMGVLNVTPDSFSDGGLYLDTDAAVEHARAMSEAGAAIVDVGGESTRPGAEPVPEPDELGRVVPVIERIVGGDVDARVSIDTRKVAVAEAALQAGARIVNDVSAFRAAPEMAGLVASAGAGCCLMHMLGDDPRTMQDEPRYDDVVADVAAFPEERVWLDPGIGFGKTLDHNLELLRRLDEIAALGRPVVIGVSRKSFLGRLTGRAEARDRVAASVAANVLAYERGASIFRVHDVAETVDALAVAGATVA